MIEFTVGQTPSLNAYMRWHYHRQTKYKKDLAWEVRALIGIRMPEVPFASATITVERFSAGDLDRDNLVGGCKPLIDCLTNLGVIEDDTEKHVRVNYLQSKCKRGEGKTVVQVSEGFEE